MKAGAAQPFAPVPPPNKSGSVAGSSSSDPVAIGQKAMPPMKAVPTTPPYKSPPARSRNGIQQDAPPANPVAASSSVGSDGAWPTAGQGATQGRIASTSVHEDPICALAHGTRKEHCKNDATLPPQFMLAVPLNEDEKNDKWPIYDPCEHDFWYDISYLPYVYVLGGAYSQAIGSQRSG